MIKKLSIVLFALVALQLNAQQESTNSPYSFYGIGSLKFKGTAENMSMGGISVYSDSIHVNLRNPASFTGKNLKVFDQESRPVKFTVGGGHTATNLKTSSASDKVNSTSFDYLALNFPVGKFGVGFGIMPYSAVGYKVESTGIINDEEKPLNRYRGEGGLNKVFLGVGYPITKNLNIGADVSYNFGTITNNAIEYLYDDEGTLINYQSRETNSSDLSGLSFSFGLWYESMVNEKLQLQASATYGIGGELTSKNSRTFATIAVNPQTGGEAVINSVDADLEASGLLETTLNLPSRYSLGVGIGEPNKWFVGGEYKFLKTSEYSNKIFNNQSNTVFEDASGFALGGFYIPDYTSFNKYWKKIVYRAGVRFENTGLKINNETINEFGISFGVGLPVGRMFSNANLGFEIGQRGTTNQNLVQENFINFQLSLSLNDRWFVKRKYN